MAVLRRREAEYCVEGYHGFRSVEHQAFENILQTCVDMGAKYGKFNIKDALFGRKAVARETMMMASDVKSRLVDQLKQLMAQCHYA